MNRSCQLLLHLIVCLVCFSAEAETLRNTEGKEINAEVLDYNVDKNTVELRSNGRSYTISLDVLDSASIAAVMEWHQRQLSTQEDSTGPNQDERAVVYEPLPEVVEPKAIEYVLVEESIGPTSPPPNQPDLISYEEDGTINYNSGGRSRICEIDLPEKEGHYKLTYEIKRWDGKADECEALTTGLSVRPKSMINEKNFQPFVSTDKALNGIFIVKTDATGFNLYHLRPKDWVEREILLPGNLGDSYLNLYSKSTESQHFMIRNIKLLYSPAPHPDGVRNPADLWPLTIDGKPFPYPWPYQSNWPKLNYSLKEGVDANDIDGGVEKVFQLLLNDYRRYAQQLQELNNSEYYYPANLMGSTSFFWKSTTSAIGSIRPQTEDMPYIDEIIKNIEVAGSPPYRTIPPACVHPSFRQNTRFFGLTRNWSIKIYPEMDYLRLKTTAGDKYDHTKTSPNLNLNGYGGVALYIDSSSFPRCSAIRIKYEIGSHELNYLSSNQWSAFAAIDEDGVRSQVGPAIPTDGIWREGFFYASPSFGTRFFKGKSSDELSLKTFNATGDIYIRNLRMEPVIGSTITLYSKDDLGKAIWSFGQLPVYPLEIYNMPIMDFDGDSLTLRKPEGAQTAATSLKSGFLWGQTIDVKLSLEVYSENKLSRDDLALFYHLSDGAKRPRCRINSKKGDNDRYVNIVSIEDTMSIKQPSEGKAFPYPEAKMQIFIPDSIDSIRVTDLLMTASN